jgi:acetyl-CoA acetyltransferase
MRYRLANNTVLWPDEGANAVTGRSTRRMAVAEAYVVDAVRTPVAKRGGALREAHPADLGAVVITEVLQRSQTDPDRVDDVIFGCVDAIGPQAGNRIMTTMLYHMRDNGIRFGVQTMYEGGGQANAAILELL